MIDVVCAQIGGVAYPRQEGFDDHGIGGKCGTFEGQKGGLVLDAAQQGDPAAILVLVEKLLELEERD